MKVVALAFKTILNKRPIRNCIKDGVPISVFYTIDIGYGYQPHAVCPACLRRVLLSRLQVLEISEFGFMLSWGDHVSGDSQWLK